MNILSRLALLFLVATPSLLKAQSVSVPDLHVDNKGKTLVKQDAKGYYFNSAANDGDTIFYCKDMSCYRMTDTMGRVMIDGEIAASPNGGYVKNGKWAEYYPTGIPQSVSYYCMGREAGMVQTYYGNGVLRARYTNTLVKGKTTQSLKAGSYQEFYENGRIKVEGFYQIAINGKNELISEKTGKWLYYDANGKKTKEETF